jgi:hypothetical protein
MTDIEPHRGGDIEPAGSTDVPREWVAAMRLTARIHNTPFVSREMRGKPDVVLAAILYGQEIGLGPMQSLNSIHVIDGRPAAAPELMRALVNRAGHKIVVDEATTDHVTLTGTRKDNGATATVSWSMADAQRAKLAGRGAWITYPRAMLLARATSELCRMLFPDVVAGLSYTPEEASAIEGQLWQPDVPLVDPVTDRAIEPAPEPEPVAEEPDRTAADYLHLEGTA